MKSIIWIGSILFVLTSCGSTGTNKKDIIESNEGTVENDTPYQCDGRQYCSEMDSYAEAVFFLEHCPNVKMDGDHDGIPCERQFNR